VEPVVPEDQINMQIREHRFSYGLYDSVEELPAEDALLLQEAFKATANAYAPYSHFRVGAAARLTNGEIITGSNQENASFPAGICAERTLLSVAAARFPGVGIATLAISYDNENGPSDHPIFPCGICRQSLQEFEQRTGSPVRVVLGGRNGQIISMLSASLLLPFAFAADELK
jgi:cytidine deaminase